LEYDGDRLQVECMVFVVILMSVLRDIFDYGLIVDYTLLLL